MVVEIDKDGDVWIIIYNWLEVWNVMDLDLVDVFIEVWIEFDWSEDVKVVVFWGVGGVFCVGWDLKYVVVLLNMECFQKEIVEDLVFLVGVGLVLCGFLGLLCFELNKFVIGVIEGFVVVGGMELVFWCDICVMVDMVYFGVYCWCWGIILMDGGLVCLFCLVGQGKVLEIVLMGCKVLVEECY